MDMTTQVEVLLDFILKTIDEELVTELEFLISYDKAKKGIQEIVDLPDRKIDLFIHCCNQNHGKISARKRSSHFELLKEAEICAMEEVIQREFGGT
jgi:hypothetical protein